MRLVEIPFIPDAPLLLSRVGLEDNSDVAGDFLLLVEKAKRLARPKAAYVAASVEEIDSVSGRVVIGGVEFFSRLLAEKLSGIETVWPHLATCGREVYDFAVASESPLERYWWDEIMNQALSDIRGVLPRCIEREFHPGRLSSMGPGSLEAWPLEQQLPLFRLLGSAAESVGIELTEHLIMLPFKSISGILFPNAEGWESCSLCRQEGCPNRRAAFDAAQADLRGY